MKIVEKSISLAELSDMSKKMDRSLVKGVVDIEKGIMAVDAQMHADLEAILLEHGSEQDNLWGINLYPLQASTPELIEFKSMINIRPAQGNKTREVEDAQIREQIRKIVAKLVKSD